MTRTEAIEAARLNVERMERDQHKAPEQVEAARKHLEQLTTNKPGCTCNSDDVPFCAVHFDEEASYGHAWGARESGGKVRACMRPGCYIRIADHSPELRAWQRKKGGLWRLEAHEPVPTCGGTRQGK